MNPVSSVFHSEGKITFQGYIVKWIINLTLASVLTINSKKRLLANFKNA